MTKTHLAKAASEPEGRFHRLEPWQQHEEQTSRESLGLSPERIKEGASTETTVLTRILAQTEQTHQWRHWGINE